MSILLIDIGNTNLKWATAGEQGFAYGGSCPSQADAIESLFGQAWAGLRPEAVYVSCVGNPGLARQLETLANSTWGIQVEILATPNQGCGIRNSYSAPAKLGSDRWAAMVAAFDQAGGPVCVVSCGTAITLDVVDATGQHLGGLILPGYALMRRSLHEGTGLPLIDNRQADTTGQLGRSTEEAIRLGTGTAVHALVARVLGQQQAELAGLQLFLTGGDATTLGKQLELSAIIEPHLVLMGLAMIHRSKKLHKPQ